MMPRATARAPLQRALAVVLFGALAAYYVLYKLHLPPGGMPFDIYGYFVPIKLYALQSVLEGGKGLLWTPYQSCGEPFFANTATGLLYPPHWLFLVFEPNVAVHLILALNLVIGAVGMLLLLRALGLRWAAAITGALVYELGDPMAQLTIWSPMQNGSWAWASWALYFCERLLRAPRAPQAIGLAAALTISIFPGWVLITALTYQLIAFRVAWEIGTRRDRASLRAAAVVAAALALAPCLAAVQLIPGFEFAQASFRVGVEVSDFVKFGGFAPAVIAKALASRTPPLPFFAALVPLVVVAPFVPAHRRLAVFWLLIAMLYGLLALGPATPLYGWYIHLPPGAALIRYAHRLFWISGLSLAFLAAFAVETFAAEPMRNRTRWLLVALVAAAVGLMHAVVPADLRPIETWATALVMAAFVAALWPPARPIAAWIIPTAAAINLMVIPLRFPGKLLDSLDAYQRYERSFAAVREKMTAQDRALFNPTPASLLSLTLMHKTASLVRIKEIYDYDALVVQRMVDYYNTLVIGGSVHSVDDLFHPKAKQEFRPRLLDVAAVRYVLTLPAAKVRERGLSLTRIGEVDAEVELYRNDQALARARYIPRLELVREGPRLLDRLANGRDDLARVAFIEEPWPSGFHGDDTPRAPGQAAFVRDDPEHLIIAVDAPARGFLFVADQFYPGWVATVNGVATPIVRGNYAFRLIEVPAGQSTVEMRYRPASVAIGGAVTLVACLVCGVVLWRSRRRA